MSEGNHYDENSQADEQKPGKSKALATYEAFTDEMKAKEAEFLTLLPSTLSKDRFMNTALAAVRQKPELLNCTPRSLFQSLIRAALDGLLPDGKEGVINAYNTKQKAKIKGKWEEWYELQAQWMPMAAGFRKRARELDNIIVDAQEVYEHDKFTREQGDDPKIIHIPAPFGKDRGKMIGAYAIYKKDGLILHRETMDGRDIETVREQSRQPDSLMWKTFTSEAYKKTVLRRGFKSVPVSDRMAEIILRDDEANFDFSQDRAPAAAIVPPPAPPPAPLQTAIEHKPQVPMTPPPAKPAGEPVAAGKEGKAAKKPAAAKKNKPAPEPEKGPETLADHIGGQEEGADEERAADEPAEKKLIPDDWQMYLDRQFDEWQAITDASTAHGVTEAVNDAVQGAEERGEIDKQQSEAINQKWDAMISANG